MAEKQVLSVLGRHARSKKVDGHSIDSIDLSYADQAMILGMDMKDGFLSGIEYLTRQSTGLMRSEQSMWMFSSAFKEILMSDIKEIGYMRDIKAGETSTRIVGPGVEEVPYNELIRHVANRALDRIVDGNVDFYSVFDGFRINRQEVLAKPDMLMQQAMAGSYWLVHNALDALDNDKRSVGAAILAHGPGCDLVKLAFGNINLIEHLSYVGGTNESNSAGNYRIITSESVNNPVKEAYFETISGERITLSPDKIWQNYRTIRSTALSGIGIFYDNQGNNI